MKPATNSAGVRLNLIRTAALLIWGAVSLAPTVARAQPPAPSKGVLVLYWYNKDYPWNVRFDQSFKAALQSAPAETVEYYSEYLETNRFPGEGQSLLLRDYLRKKYADHTIDVVVANSDASLDFLLKYRDDLFPHTPIVFVAARHPAKEELAAGPGLTGVINVNTHRKTLDLALRLHPGTEQVFIISGTLRHDKKFETLAREELQGYESRAHVNYLTDLAPDELTARVKKLPKRSIVLYVWQQSQNEQGKVIESAEIFASIAQSVPVPIYGMSYPILGNGIVGGYIITSEATGTKVAEIAMRIANGERAQNIPVEGAPTAPMFDWRQLRRWGISEDQLPTGRIIRFKEESFWDHYKWRIIGVVSLCIVEGLLIFALLAQRARRRHVEEALRDNEERLKLALGAANMGAWDWRLGANDVTWSEETRRIFGLANGKSAVKPEAFLNLIHPDDRSAVSQAITRAIEQGATYDVEFRVAHEGGIARWVMGKGKALFDDTGRAVRMLGVNMDITARKQAEDRLTESEAQLRLLTELIPQHIWTTHPGNTDDYRNRRWLDYTGMTIEEVRQKGWMTALHPDDHEIVFNAIREASSQKGIYEVEIRLKGVDGQYRWFLARAIPQLDQEGNVIKWYGTNTDIEGHKQAEQALRESEERLRLALEAGRMGVWERDARTDAVKWSKESYTIMGLSPFSLEPHYQTWAERVHPDDLPVANEKMRKAIEEKGDFRYEYRIIWPDGGMRWVEGRGKPIYDEDGQCLKVSGLVVDITETKRAELNTQFINQLDFELSQIADADEIIRLATGRLGEYLGVASCYVIEVNPAADLAVVRESWHGWRLDGKSIVGEYRVSDFTTPEFREALEAGQAAVVNDVRTDPRTRDFASKYEAFGVGAFVTIPALNEKHWEASLNINHPQARDWRPDETQLMRDVTARLWPAFKRARAVEALRESEARFRNMADNAPVMVWVTEADGSCSFVSQSWYEFTGQTPGTGLGFGWVGALHPDDRELSEKTFLAANEKREAFRLEYRLRRKDGEYRWAIDSARPRFGSQGEFLGYIGSVVDITETKRAELNTQFINQLDFELSQIADADEIIRLATGRLGEYLGVASCYVIEVNPAAGLAFVRESWDGWRIAGPSIVGEYRISDFVTPECLDEFEAGRATVVKDVMNDPRMRDFTSKYESLGVGAFISIPALNERQWEANLTVDHPQARDWRPDETQLMRDITARLWPAFKRTRAVEALRDSEERFRQLAENIGAAFFITEGFSETPPGQLRYVSPAYEKIWGRSRESLYQDTRSWLEAVHPDDIERVMDALRSAGRAQLDEEFRITRPDGEVRWVHDRVFPIRDKDGEIYRLAGIVEDITGRKMIEEALRESEERYRSVVENQTELICRYLPDTTLTFVNNAYCRYFGKLQEELIGKKFLELIPESAREFARKHVESLVENPRVEIDEHEVLLPNGGIGWQQWVDHAILDANGKVVEFQAVGRDITERKQMEEDLRESEERLRLALEAGRMGVWEWDTRTNAVKWSNEHYTVMGFRPFSVEPDYYTWADRVHPDDLSMAAGAMSRAIAEVREYRCEYRITWPDGSVRWVEGRGKPVYDEGGQCLKVGGLIVDITERKQAEDALRLSEDKFSKAFRSSPDAIGIGRQADGMILEVNGRWEEILGYTRDEAAGRTVSELQIYQTPGERARLVSLVREQGSVRDFEVDFRKKSGEIRNILISADPIMIRDEPCLLVIVRDVTELKRAEEALRRNEEALRKSYARIEDLAGRLIAAQEDERRHIARELHDDLNQQVAALAIGISRLKRQFPDAGAAVQEQIARLLEKTDWLSERIRQVSHDLHSSVLQHVGLPAALNSYCEEFSDREGIAVTLDIRDGVEAISPDAALCLYRVAQESLRNVARHSGARSAIVALARVNGAVELRVADQGVGFDPGQAREGRGLGLVSMEERVKLLHGNFVLTTRPGAGTELRAQIPLRWEYEQNKSLAG